MYSLSGEILNLFSGFLDKDIFIKSACLLNKMLQMEANNCCMAVDLLCCIYYETAAHNPVQPHTMFLFHFLSYERS